VSAATTQYTSQALAAEVRATVAEGSDWAATATQVGERLRAYLARPMSRTIDHWLGAGTRPESRLLHVEPTGAFSILAVVWSPGQLTRIHDHLTWCAFGVVTGVEREELFDADLNPLSVNDTLPGQASGFAPPGDIHRVANITGANALSIHIYGTDLARVSSSVRRYYDPPQRTHGPGPRGVDRAGRADERPVAGGRLDA
jgi:predicted metal-dependent enzyme (double-stranded beta helix superfamily)